jgi:hypothetical protein
MNAVFEALALGAACLLAVAVLIACWEHWFRRIQDPAATPPESPRAVTVDLDVDRLPAPPAPTDQGTRRAALGAAMDAMARPPADVTSTTPLPGSWIQTRPMVLTSTKTEAEPH